MPGRRVKGPVGGWPTASPDVRPDEARQGPPSRLIEEESGPDYTVVHWAPELALGFSCVTCRRTWTRRTDWDTWEATGGPLEARPLVHRGGGVYGLSQARIEELEAEVERPKVPVCRSCGKADIRLDADGRVLSHRDSVTGGSCRGRGYMPRMT